MITIGPLQTQVPPRTIPRNVSGAENSRTGAYGYAVDRKTKREAEAEAFRICGTNCDLLRTFRDSCGAVAARPKRVASDTGASREIAEAKALRKCGDNCKIAVWACTSEK